MAYGVTVDVRSLANNPPASDVTDATIDKFIADADSLINIETGKSNWVSTDVEFSAIRTASNLYAAASILSFYSDPGKKADGYRNEFWRIIKSIRQTAAQASPNEQVIFKTAGSED